MSTQESKPRRKFRPAVGWLILFVVAAATALGVKWALNADARQSASQAARQVAGQAAGQAAAGSQAARRGKVYLRWETDGGLCNQVSWLLGENLAFGMHASGLPGSAAEHAAAACYPLPCAQLLGHVNGLTLALAMGADGVVLPHTKHRGYFDHTRSEWRAAMPQAGAPCCPAPLALILPAQLDDCQRSTPAAGSLLQAAASGSRLTSLLSWT